MANNIQLANVREALGINLECMKSLLELLAASDEAARTMRCRPGDPDCPDPRVDSNCTGFKKAGLTVLEALENVHDNFNIYLKLLEEFEAPPIPLPEYWVPTGDEASA
jgi:hypothetical protein